DLGQPGAGAGLVLVPAGRAADADGADRLVADLDRQAALLGGELGIEDARIEGALCRDALLVVARRLAQDGRGIGLAATERRPEPVAVVGDRDQLHLAI